GNRYILVLIDHFTKWCEAIPVPRIDARTTADTIFAAWVSRWGVPYQLHSDRGAKFESSLVKELCRVLGSSKSRTTAYHPQGNGVVERVNLTLKGFLQAFVNQDSTRHWDEAIPHCLLSYRATVQASTGQTPHFMVTGREMRIPADMNHPHPAPDGLLASDYVIQSRERLVRSHQLARRQLQAEHRRQKEYYDKSTFGSPLEPGDRVWLRSEQADLGLPAKFHRAWRGPYEVCEVLSASACSIRSLRDPNQRPFTVHFDGLKPDTTAAFSGNPGPRNVAVQLEIPAEGGSGRALGAVPS
ncbi:Retrovirus Pol polyprotein from transposon, partial [Fasciola gigantica]